MPEDAVSARAAMTFGARIQELRRARSLTQRQAAGELGIDFTYLSKLENDRGEAPGEELIRKMAELYGVEADELLALAGKVPAELRQRASEDKDFALFLRRLPSLGDETLAKLYRAAKKDSDSR